MRGGVLEARSARRRAVAKVRTGSESAPADARRAGVLGKPEEIGGALAQIVGAPGAGDQASVDALGARGIVITRDVPEPASAAHRELVRVELAPEDARKRYLLPFLASLGHDPGAYRPAPICDFVIHRLGKSGRDEARHTVNVVRSYAPALT
jgi:hypothetical protein